MAGGFRSFNVRAKLLLAFLSIIALSVVLVFFSLRAIRTITENKTINEKLENLELQLVRQELAMKEFMYEGYKETAFQESDRSSWIDTLRKNRAQSLVVLHFLEQRAPEHRLRWQELGALMNEIDLEFDSVRINLKARGFKDFGLEGSLRQAIHAVENGTTPVNKERLLTLRRNEKDFFLRKDLKYQDDFNKNMEVLKAESDPNSPALVQLARYQEQFNTVVAIEKRIGLRTDDGLRGELKKELEATKPLLASVKSQVMADNQAEINQARWVLVLIFFAQLVLGLVLAVFYSNAITRAIREIRDAMQQLASGTFPQKLHVKTQEELGQMRTALNHLVDQMAVATQFADQLGNGNLRAQYDERFANDVLARAIVRMQTKMLEAESAQARINWTNEGLARLSDLLKDDTVELRQLGDRLLHLVVTYLDANQAALYVKKEDELLRICTYAYGKKRFAEETIPLGQGLAGQCALEGETIFLTDVPNGYVKITSGLGEATPTNVVVVPLKLKQNIFGILELASFEKITDLKITFLEKIAENMAALIASKQANETTHRLLEESRQKAEMLTQQEEEMRQNAEELQAIQEQQDRQRMEMQREILQLKTRLLAFEQRHAPATRQTDL